MTTWTKVLAAVCLLAGCCCAAEHGEKQAPAQEGDWDEYRHLTFRASAAEVNVPGKPEMFGTTKEFLDYFGLRRLDELPTLAEIRDLDSINVELDFGPEMSPGEAGEAANEETPDQSGTVELDDSLEERVAGEPADGPGEAPEDGGASEVVLDEAAAEDPDATADDDPEDDAPPEETEEETDI